MKIRTKKKYLRYSLADHQVIKFIRCFSLVLLFIFATSCRSNLPKNVVVDNFYTNHGEWDSGRIPFIKPYEVVITTREFSWFMNLEGADGDTGFEHVKKATIIDGIILVYSTNSIFHGEEVKQTWHIIIPAKHIEKGFRSEWAYLDYLGSIGITRAPKLHDIDSLAKYFENNDYMDWKEVSKW